MRNTSYICAFSICLLLGQSSFGEIVSVKLTTNALGLGGMPLNAGSTVGPDLPGFVTSPTVGEGSVLSIQKSGVAGVGSVSDPLFVTITGRSHLDTLTGVPSPSDYFGSAIYIDSEDTALPDGSKEGIGVRAFHVNAAGLRTFTGGLARVEGSKHVSGGTGPTTFDPGSPNGSPHVDEDVLFTFDAGVAANGQSIEVLLSDYDADDIIDLHIERQAGSPIDLSFLQTSDTALFQQLGTNLWKVRFSAPSLGLTATDVVTSFRIRANEDNPSYPSGTAEHFFIAGMTVDAIITECDGNTPGECDDSMPCSIDTCVGGQCVHEPVQCPIGLQCDPISGACVECSPALKCPPVDLVFVMDTSGSMQDEGEALCNAINNVVMLLLADGINVTPTILAIAPINNNNLFSCQTPADTVSALLGNPVPGNNGTCSNDLTGPGNSNRDENWGSASSIVADRYPWTPGAQRIIVPISDEGPCMGSSSNGCNDPGSDRDAITNAIAVALANEVAISPITAMGSSTCVITLAQSAAAGTGGIWHPSTDPKVDLATSIANIVQVACSKSDQCDDGDICTVADTCVNGQCDGTPTDCDDLNECTIDECDPITGGCTHTPSDALCDNGNACDGIETCDATLGCQSGTPLSCDNLQFCDGLETCDPVAGCQPGTPPSCDDGVACTVGSCDEILDVCVQTPMDTLCDNGQFCDGSETCDAILGCQAGTPVNCDDGVACTNDACDEVGNVCVSTPSDTLCDNGLYCDGVETCDALLGCQAGTAPNCDDGVACTDDSCDEVGDVCVNSANNGNCDDLVGCTVDVCDAILGCGHTPDDSLCDNSLYCDGTETCDALTDCQPGTPPNCDDSVACTTDACDETNDICTHLPVDAACSDGVTCTVDVCDPIAGCSSTPDDGLCDNMVFCDGTETCDPVNDCQSGTNPCVPPLKCEEAGDQCVDCLTDAQCDDGLYCNGAETCTGFTCVAGTPPNCSDGVGCTDDSCDEATDTCVHTANDSLCDNGLYCDGMETCDSIMDCQVGTAPNCNDGVGCTIDSCDEVIDQCVNAPDNSLCDNGAYCDGMETCDAISDCQAGTPPNCGDGVSCTVDTCNEATDVCDHAATDSLCDNGQFCDGSETCDAVNDCQAGTPPVCDDGVPCTVDSCDAAQNQCLFVPTNTLCDNGQFCDGAEICDAANGCQAGAAPNCNDGIACTDDSCDEVANVCVNTANDGLCDNGLFCDGSETCNAAIGCQAGTAPNCDDGIGCTADSCDEANNTCVNAGNNAACDDGNPCTLDVCADNGCTHPDFCGACCVGGVCTSGVLLNQCVDVLGGEFRGPGTTCAGGPCEIPLEVPTVSEWGLAVLALMLLTLHKVYFRRRTAAA